MVKLLSKSRIKKLVDFGFIYEVKKGVFKSLEMGNDEIYKIKKRKKK